MQLKIVKYTFIIYITLLKICKNMQFILYMQNKYKIQIKNKKINTF